MNIVVLISGNGSNLQAIIDSGIPIAAVISNKADAFGLTRAERAGIPARVLDHTSYESREAFDDALLLLINEYNADLVVLAGFMRILSEDFVTHFEGRLINIHPSLLPKYKGLNTHRRVLEAGDPQHGVSVHFVTTELDGGPVIAQASLDVDENDSESSLQDRIHQLEHQLYPYVIDQIREGHISLSQDRVVFDGKPLAKSGIMLNL